MGISKKESYYSKVISMPPHLLTPFGTSHNPSSESPKEPKEIPLVVGIQGWRQLNVYIQSLSGSLDPLVYLQGQAGNIIDSEWSEPAVCLNNEQVVRVDIDCNEVPGLGCSCGYYILKDPPPSSMMMSLIAKVSTSGRTIRCENGYKTYQYRIDEIYIRPMLKPLKERLEEMFNCPVFMGYPE